MKKLLLFTSLLLFVTVTYGQSNIYHETDKEGLREILRDGDSRLLQYFPYNFEVAGLTVEDTLTWYENELWIPKIKQLEWNNDTPRRVVGMDFNYRLRTETTLDFTPFPELQSLNISSLIPTQWLAGEGNIIISNNTKLKKLYLIYSYFDDYDLSSCPELESLTLLVSNCKPIDLKNLPNLKSITLDRESYIKDANFDFSNNLLLEDMMLGYAFNSVKMKKFDISRNERLKSLWLYAASTESDYLDLSGNQYLEHLMVSGSNSKFNLSGSTNLKSVTFFNVYNLEELKLDGCTALEDLYISWSLEKLETLDVSSCTSLKNLKLIHLLKLKKLILGEINPETVVLETTSPEVEADFSRMFNLKRLEFPGVKFFESKEDWADRQPKTYSLDLSQCSNLKYLDCSHRLLTELILPENSKLDTVNCSNNLLMLSKLPLSDINYYMYGVQRDIAMDTRKAEALSTIDLSSESIIDGIKTEFNWYIDDILGDGEAYNIEGKDGVFTMPVELVGKRIFCRMTNARFPDLSYDYYVNVAAPVSIEKSSMESVSLESTVINVGSPVVLLAGEEISGTVAIYTMSGQRVSQYPVSGVRSEISIPDNRGVYFLDVQLRDGEKYIFKFIVR